jgi:hypothetical protein
MHLNIVVAAFAGGLLPPAFFTRQPQQTDKLITEETQMFTLIKAKKTALVKALSALKSRFSSKLINRSSKTYLAEKGWRRFKSSPGYEWHGYYRSRYGSFKGRVLASASPSFYVYKPPEALKLKHSHSACFSSHGDGWYSVHFKRIPGDPDSGVMAIERILTESMRLQ